MLVFEAIIAAVLVVCVAGGLFLALALDRAGRLKLDAARWWWLVVPIGLLGISIAWITSALV